MKEAFYLKDIVQIQMDSSQNEKGGVKHPGIAATIQTDNLKVSIRNGIDKYILYIILKELGNNAS